MAAGRSLQTKKASESLAAALMKIATESDRCPYFSISAATFSYLITLLFWPGGHNIYVDRVNRTIRITDDAFVRYLLKSLKHGAILTINDRHVAYLNGTWEGLPKKQASIWLGEKAEDWPAEGRGACSY